MKQYAITTTCLLIALSALIYDGLRVQHKLYALDQKITGLENLAVLDAKCERFQADVLTNLVYSLLDAQKRMIDLEMHRNNMPWIVTNIIWTNYYNPGDLYSPTNFQFKTNYTWKPYAF